MSVAGQKDLELRSCSATRGSATWAGGHFSLGITDNVDGLAKLLEGLKIMHRALGAPGCSVGEASDS